MSAKTVFYLSVLVVAVLLLAFGGFLVKAGRRLVGRRPTMRPRFA